MSDVVCPGTLRLSKGAWLFRPDAVDVLLRVSPTPEPSMEGFFSRPVRARLSVTGHAHGTDGAPVIEPRTGVPDRIGGRVVDVADDQIVIDAGVPFLVSGVAAAVGDSVTVSVDVDAGVGCAIDGEVAPLRGAKNPYIHRPKADE